MDVPRLGDFFQVLHGLTAAAGSQTSFTSIKALVIWSCCLLPRRAVHCCFLQCTGHAGLAELALPRCF